MATLSKHGNHKQVEYITYKVALCQDGSYLRNYGHGWKLHTKLKPGVDYLTAYANRIKKIEETQETRPIFAAYKRAMLRWKLLDRVRISYTFDLLGDDLDGIWSELADGYDRVDIDLEEIREIHNLRRAAAKEKELA